MHNLFAGLLLAAAAAITPAAIQHRDAIASKLSPTARLKLQNVATSLRQSPTISEVSARAAILSAFPGANLGAADIDALMFVVMMDAAQDAQKDLNAIMAEVKAIDKQKESLRQELSKLNALTNSTHVRKARVPLASFNVPPPLPKGATVDQMKDRLDSLSELGETESLRLQMAMDRLSKLMQTLSNLEKKAADTASSIVKNLK